MARDMSEALIIDKVTTHYGKEAILDDISLSVTSSEVFGLIGLNGVGKTTLIKSILTLVRPTSGSVRIFGQDFMDPASRAKLAYLPEKFQPPALLTGAEFIRFSLASFGLDYDLTHASEMAENLGFDPASLDRRMGVYSKGMNQKLGLLATFMTGQPLLILDEPMSGLDPKARILLKRQIAKYREDGNTIFLSSHILADLDEMCDRVGILHNGTLVYDGTPADLKKRADTPSLEQAFLDVIEGDSTVA